FISFFFSLIRLPPSPTLFPYTTLFRSLIIFEIMRSFFLGSKERATNLAALHWWASARNLRTLAVSVSALLHFDFDCFWLRHGAFWQVNLQYAVMKLSHDLGWVRIFGYGERTLKGAEEA